MRVKGVLVLDEILPFDVIKYIDKFMFVEKPKKANVSPSMQKELYRIQTLSLRGKSPMYMKDLIDFCLD